MDQLRQRAERAVVDAKLRIAGLADHVRFLNAISDQLDALGRGKRDAAAEASLGKRLEEHRRLLAADTRSLAEAYGVKGKLIEPVGGRPALGYFELVYRSPEFRIVVDTSQEAWVLSYPAAEGRGYAPGRY